MSVQEATSVSQIDVLEVIPVRSASMDVRRKYRKLRSVPVTIQNTGSRDNTDLRMRGLEASHKLYFGVNPGVITEENRLMYNGTVFRPVGLLTNVQERNIIWTLFADTRTRDNEKIELVA